MQFDTVETGFNRQAGRVAVSSDNISNFRNAQCVRGDEILQASCSISLTRCLYRGRGLGLCTVRQERWMGHSSTVHQLHKDAAAASMNGASDFLPGGHLVSGFDTRGAYIAFTHGNRKYAFADDQTCRSTLKVVSGDQIGRYASIVRARASHWRHDHTVGEGVTTYFDFGKKRVHCGVPQW